MSDYERNYQEEILYLDKTLTFIKKRIDKEDTNLKNKFKSLIDTRREMWEDTAHFVSDFAKLTEVNQHLSEINRETAGFSITQKQIDKYKRMIDSPYFGRFDFIEENSGTREKIYIGLYSIMDTESNDVLVYDWRAPISSIFYRCEPGSASYHAPDGEITGEVLLKRQYKIKKSLLKYYFDSSIRINDEMLQEVLSRNSTSMMRNIVETIQKEQDIIIRDTENELLIVQGVAGSGKTSIALHRIAFLLYEGMNSNINSNNIIIVSPSLTFSKYISDVLPELGEENVEQTTFDDIASLLFENKFIIESKDMHLESLILSQDTEENDIKNRSAEFKGSNAFVEILDRLLKYYEYKIIDFHDIYFDGKIIETREQLKSFFLSDKIGIPIAKRLKRIEGMILDKIHPMQKQRLNRIEKLVQKSQGHDFEIKSFSRLLSIKRTRAFIEQLRKFTEVDYLNLYKMLFSDKRLFERFTAGCELPKCIEKIVLNTGEKLKYGYIDYEDCAPLLYLKLRIEGSDFFSEIRQVVIDEAQDYYPVQYQVFKLLFKDSNFTILGDINQTVAKDTDISLYNSVVEILDKKKSIKLVLNKSYRSSMEIGRFTKSLLDNNLEVMSFERHEAEPIIASRESREMIDQAITSDINHYQNQGYGSIAVICKTQLDADEVRKRLQKLADTELIDMNGSEIHKGISVIPSYMTKGMEYDVVLLYDASDDNYSSDIDRKLLYIACTRALHRLVIYYTGTKSRFIKDGY